MSAEDVKQERESEREHQVHQQLLSRVNGDTNAPEALKYISEGIEGIDSPSEVLKFINSKATTTTQLSENDVRSKEWVIEYLQLIDQMDRPPHYGVHGTLRAWARGDREAAKEPLEPGDAMEFESFSEMGKLATKKSEGGWGVETATKDTVETLQRKEERKKGNKILDRFR